MYKAVPEKNPARMVEIYLSIDRECFHYLKFILEGYENSAVLSSVPGHQNIVRLRCSADNVPELIEILDSIAHRIKRKTLC